MRDLSSSQKQASEALEHFSQWKYWKEKWNRKTTLCSAAKSFVLKKLMFFLFPCWNVKIEKSRTEKKRFHIKI